MSRKKLEAKRMVQEGTKISTDVANIIYKKEKNTAIVEVILLIIVLAIVVIVLWNSGHPFLSILAIVGSVMLVKYVIEELSDKIDKIAAIMQDVKNTVEK